MEIHAVALRALVVLLAGGLGLTGCATSSGSDRRAADSREAAASERVAVTPQARAKERERKEDRREPHAPADGTVSRREFAQARAHHSLGLTYLRDGQVAMAIRELRAAEELNPYDSWIQLALAEGYRQRGHLDDAEKHLLKALQYDPDFQNARLTLSGLYIQMERYEEAIEHARILEKDPTFPTPWTALSNQGFAELQLGRIDDARRSLRTALDYYPRYWRAHLNLGILEEKAGNRLEALRHFERVVELGPGPQGEAEANYRSAEIQISLGNREAAVEHLVAASSAVSNGPWGKRSEDYLKRLR